MVTSDYKRSPQIYPSFLTPFDNQKNLLPLDGKNSYFIHYKGGLYRLMAIATNSETLEEVVVYQALYGEHKIWIRPKKMFFEIIRYNDKNIARFKEIDKEEMECLLQKLKNNI